MRVLAFDSGVGGLTAIAPLIKKYPGLEVHYFGDLANLPYGTKSPQHIRDLTEKNLRWLLEREKNYSLAVVACNTASAHALEIAQKAGQSFQVPVIGVLEAGCVAAMKSSGKRIVILATSGTVSSQSYVKKLRELSCKKEIIQKACPLFVPLVEDHLYSGPAVEWIIRNYLDSILLKDDAVILGCTHYPFLRGTLAKIYPEVEWIDAGAALLDDSKIIKLLESAKESKEAKRAPIRCVFSDSTVSSEKIEAFLKELALDSLICQVEIARP